MLDSRPFGTLQVVGAAQGQVPLWGRSDVPLARPPASSPRCVCFRMHQLPQAPGNPE